MQGRLTFTPDIDKAANFIAGEMKATGLQTWPGADDYLQKFSLKKLLSSTADATINGITINNTGIISLSGNEKISFNETSNYKVVVINRGDNFRAAARPLLDYDSNMLVLVDTSFSRNFGNLKRLQTAMADRPTNKVFVLTDIKAPGNYSFNITQRFSPLPLMNVIGYLPGRSKPGEYVIFSAHYDHLGIGKPDEKGDSIYNGANDDASGVTAMLSLAKYYKAQNNNERSLIFVAFTGEEMGGYGSTYFSNHINPLQAVAMFNIEMVGTDSKWGNGSAYITGFDKSDLGSILQKNVAGTKFSFYADPYTEQQLFYRSDNATLARLGVPAHTISTSKMDSEPHYHKPGDEIQTLDMANMTEVIKAIALGAKSIVSGADTPSRIKKEDLK